MSDFVVLGIDQSTKSSGWAIRGVYPATSGVATGADGIRAVVDRAKSLSMGRPVVAVLEDHRAFAFSRGNMSVKSLLGMGAARGRWQQELEHAGIDDVHMVEPRVWRGKVLGLGPRVSGEQAKAAARRHAAAVLGFCVSDDEAEALCIALWGEMNLQPKVKRKRAPRPAPLRVRSR